MIADKVLQVACCIMTKVARRVLTYMYGCCGASRVDSHTVLTSNRANGLINSSTWLSQMTSSLLMHAMSLAVSDLRRDKNCSTDGRLVQQDRRVVSEWWLLCSLVASRCTMLSWTIVHVSAPGTGHSCLPAPRRGGRPNFVNDHRHCELISMSCRIVIDGKPYVHVPR